MTSRKLTQDIIRILLPPDYSPRDEVWDAIEDRLDAHAAEARAEQRQRDADIVTEMELDTTTAFTYQQLRVNILNSEEER